MDLEPFSEYSNGKNELCLLWEHVRAKSIAFLSLPRERNFVVENLKSSLQLGQNKQHLIKVMLDSFLMNGRTLVFHPETHKLEPSLPMTHACIDHRVSLFTAVNDLFQIISIDSRLK